MKVGTRKVPLDMLSLEEKGRRILISTCRQKIVLTTRIGDEYHQVEKTFDQLFRFIAEMEARK